MYVFVICYKSLRLNFLFQKGKLDEYVGSVKYSVTPLCTLIEMKLQSSHFLKLFCYITYRVNILKLYIVYDGKSGELKLSNVSKYSSYDFIFDCLGNRTKKNYDISLVLYNVHNVFRIGIFENNFSSLSGLNLMTSILCIWMFLNLL